jgi:FO synthase
MTALPVRADVDGLSREHALALAEVRGDELRALMAAAAAMRDRHWGRAITFSPKVFLPLTNLCRNHCDYCSYRRSPGDEGAWTMTHAEVDAWVERGRAYGCIEALFCLGDKPESAFAEYRRQLRAAGHDGTVHYLAWAGRRALDAGLLPHTNAGVLSAADMARLRPVNASMGLMLETSSERLCEKGMPHHRAPDKRPAVRLHMHEEAGELRIPFTSGILVGIGESARERVESLLAIRDVHARHGHIQEVIVQNFTPRPGVPMADAPEADDDAMAHAIAMARLVLPPEVSVQSPPNLNATRTALLLRAGVNDLGGISPVTPDYINPRHPWPLLPALRDVCAREGFALWPRLPVYDRFVDEDGWLDEGLRDAVQAQRAALVTWWARGAGVETTSPSPQASPEGRGERAEM